MARHLPFPKSRRSNTMAPSANVQAVEELAGKYLIFLLGKEEFGVSVLKVREIIPMQVIVSVPQAPAHIRGVINLRGTAIAVMDLRKRFGLEHIDETERTCVIVAEVETKEGALRIGMVVDGVAEVQNIAAAEIEPPPNFGVPAASYLLGMAKNRNKMRLLLDIEQVLGRSEHE